MGVSLYPNWEHGWSRTGTQHCLQSLQSRIFFSLRPADKAWTNSHPLVILVCTGSRAEVSSLTEYDARLHINSHGRSGILRSSPSSITLHNSCRRRTTVAETVHPEILIADIHEKDSPVTTHPHPLERDSVCRRELSRFIPVWVLLLNPPQYPDLTE
jgi:hypothetical protein